MPKKKKARKNTKNAAIEKRKLVEADDEGQVYGIIEKALGSRFFDVNCLDSMKRRCKVRKKRMRVLVGDCVIVSLRDFDVNNADIIYRYDTEEARQLQKAGIIPSTDVIGHFRNGDADEEEDECAFEFDDI